MFLEGQLSQRIFKSFALLLGVLLLLTAFSLFNFRRMANAEARNQHSYQVLLETYQLNDSLNLMDGGVRGYATTGKIAALSEFEEGLRVYREHFAIVKNLTADRSEHQKRLERLDRQKQIFVNQRLRPIIVMRRATPDDTRAILQLRRVTLARRATLAAAQKVINEIEVAESAIQNERSVRLQQSQVLTQWTLAAGSFFSIGLTFWLVSLSVKGSRRLDEANRHLQQAQERTEVANRELLSTNARLEAEIVQRRAAEENLSRSVEELKKSNAELEQFAYVASHDLQEPLRAVGGCVQVLQRRYEGQLDARADQFIQHAVDGAQRMQNLINDLLAYSRVGTKGKSFEWVEGAQILAGALQSVSASARESGAQITRDELPLLWCDAGQIEQVLQNLLSNAIKFRGEAPPRIHIGCRSETNASGESFWEFSVRDEGLGIEPQYFERIFVMFQRLHTRTQYPGTGIGLAICKKIIERHGGTLWLESQLGQGSTFLFRLPAQPDQKSGEDEAACQRPDHALETATNPVLPTTSTSVSASISLASPREQREHHTVPTN